MICIRESDLNMICIEMVLESIIIVNLKTKLNVNAVDVDDFGIGMYWQCEHQQLLTLLLHL